MAAAMTAMMGATALLLLNLLVYASATVHTVGDSNGWSPGVDYRTWASDKTFAVGDTLVFNYGGGFHSVQEVSSTGFASCTTGNALASDGSGSTSITLKTAGAHYFVCGALGHCNQGMKLAVTVGAGAGSTEGTAPPLPAGSTEGAAPPLPAGSTEGPAPPLPAGSTEGTAPPLPVGSTEGAAPSLPVGSTEGTAPSLPAGSTEGTAPPLPVGSTEGTAPPLPAGSTEGTAPPLTVVGEGTTPPLPTTGETPRTRTFGTPSTPSLTTLDTIPQASSTGMTSPSAAAFASAAAMLLFALP